MNLCDQYQKTQIFRRKSSLQEDMVSYQGSIKQRLRSKGAILNLWSP